MADRDRLNRSCPRPGPRAGPCGGVPDVLVEAGRAGTPRLCDRGAGDRRVRSAGGLKLLGDCKILLGLPCEVEHGACRPPNPKQSELAVRRGSYLDDLPKCVGVESVSDGVPGLEVGHKSLSPAWHVPDLTDGRRSAAVEATSRSGTGIVLASGLLDCETANRGARLTSLRELIRCWGASDSVDRWYSRNGAAGGKVIDAHASHRRQPR